MVQTNKQKARVPIKSKPPKLSKAPERKPIDYSESTVDRPIQIKPTGATPVEMARRSVLMANRLPQRSLAGMRGSPFRAI